MHPVTGGHTPLPGEFALHIGAQGPGGVNCPQHGAFGIRRRKNRNHAGSRLERLLRALRLAGEGERPGFLDGDPGQRLGIGLHGFDPAEQRDHFAAHQERAAVPLDQVSRLVHDRRPAGYGGWRRRNNRSAYTNRAARRCRSGSSWGCSISRRRLSTSANRWW